MEQNKPMPWPFDESEIHFVETADGERLIPLVDLADAIGYSRRGLHQIAGMNRDVFGDNFVNLSTGKQSQVGDRQGEIALNEHSVDLLLMKVSASRIKDHEKSEKLLCYQHWIMETLTPIAKSQGFFRVLPE